MRLFSILLIVLVGCSSPEPKIQVDEKIYRNLQEFIKDKKNDEQLFELINTTDINKYLQTFMKDLTAKVFRTYNASELFQREIDEINKKLTQLSENAIQEQTTDESVLRAAEPELGLQEVGEGNRPQVIAAGQEAITPISKGTKEEVISKLSDEQLAKLTLSFGSKFKTKKQLLEAIGEV